MQRLLLLQPPLGRQALTVAEDGSQSYHLALAQVTYRAVARRRIAVDLGAVPIGGVADVVDADVVVHGPEEGHGVELLARPEHVARRRLPLALRHHPMLDAHAAAAPIGPAR